MSKLIIKWSVFSYLFAAALSLAQQVVFTYYLTSYSTKLWTVLVFDILASIYILYNSTPRLSVIHGASCWAANTRLLIFKIVFIYIILLPQGLGNNSLVFRGSLVKSSEIALVNSLTVLIYTLWVFQTGNNIYNGIRKISIEHLLHIELVLRVIIDLLDIIDAFFSFVFDDKLHYLSPFVVFGYSAALYFHGYSFPKIGIEKYLNSNESRSITMTSNEDANSSGDVRYCRKNAIIVGTWFVDILIGTCRLIAIYTTGNPRFSIFFLKNIYSILLYFGLFSSISIIPKLLKANEIVESHISDNKFDFNVIKPAKLQISPKSKQADNIENTNYLWSSKNSDKNYFSKPSICFSPSILEYIYKLASSIEFSSRTDLHHFLNPTCIKFDCKLRVIFTYLLFVFFKITSVVIFAFVITKKNDIIVHYFTGNQGTDRSCGHVIIAMLAFIFLLNFCCLFPIATLFESFFGGIFAAMRLLSFIAMLSIFSQSQALNSFLANLNFLYIEKYIMCAFALSPFINLLSNMYSFISAILGKKFTSYIIISVDKFGEAKDQVNVIPISTLILLVSAQNLLLPKSAYKYFSSNYIISTYRLNFLISWVHLRKVSILIFIRILLLMLLENEIMIITYAGIFGLHAMMLIHYLISTRIMRHAILQKIEMQIMSDSNQDFRCYDSDHKNRRNTVFTADHKFLPDLVY